MGWGASAQDYTPEEYARIGSGKDPNPGSSYTAEGHANIGLGGASPSTYGSNPRGVDNSKNPWATGEITPNYKKNRQSIMDLYEARARLGAPVPVKAYSAAYRAPTGPSQAAQGTAAMALQAASDGKGPSVASHVAGQGVDDAIRARMAAQAAAPRYGSAGLASSQAAGTASAAMQSAAVQSALAKAQEVQAAQQAYSGLATSMRGADIATAAEANRVGLSNAQLAQAAGLQNQSAAMQWEAMGDAERNALIGMSMGLDQNEMANRINYEAFKYGGQKAAYTSSMRDRMLADQQYAQLVAGGGAAAGAFAKGFADNSGGGWDSYESDLRGR